MVKTASARIRSGVLAVQVPLSGGTSDANEMYHQRGLDHLLPSLALSLELYYHGLLTAKDRRFRLRFSRLGSSTSLFLRRRHARSS